MEPLRLEDNRTGTRIREDRMTTLIKRPSEQFSYWRALVAPVVEIDPPQRAEGGFRATFRGHHLGKLQIATIKTDAMQYRRTRQTISKVGLDHWQLVLRRRGHEISRSGAGVLKSGPGSLDLLSYAMPITADSSASEFISIWMNRDHFPGMTALFDAASHRPIQGAMKHILQEFILSLERHRSSLAPGDVPAVTSSLTALLSAAVRPTLQNIEDAAKPIHACLFETARKYICANLADPGLDAERLSQDLRISRRKLYYLFERKGGVAKFIRQQRLAACHLALESVQDARLISTIAYDHGFCDAGQFSRHFKAHFGYSPREVREATAVIHETKASAPANFKQWLMQEDGP